MKKVIIAFLMIIFLFLPGCSDAYKESQYSKVLNEYVYSEYLIGFNETGTAKKFKKNLLYSDNNVFEISKTNKVTNNICAYVDSDVLASLYEVKSIFEEVDNDSSIFYTDSLLRAYQIAQSKIIENIRPEFYINKNEYPIHWYDVKNNKKIKSEFDNMVLIGVIECENYKFNSLGNNKSFNTIVLQETYEYFTNFKTKDNNIRDKKNNVLSSLLFNYTDSGKEFIFEKNFDLILYLNSQNSLDLNVLLK